MKITIATLLLLTAKLAWSEVIPLPIDFVYVDNTENLAEFEVTYDSRLTVKSIIYKDSQKTCVSYYTGYIESNSVEAHLTFTAERATSGNVEFLFDELTEFNRVCHTAVPNTLGHMKTLKCRLDKPTGDHIEICRVPINVNDTAIGDIYVHSIYLEFVR